MEFVPEHSNESGNPDDEEINRQEHVDVLLGKYLYKQI